MRKLDRQFIMQLFNEVLDVFKLEVDSWSKKTLKIVVLNERDSRLSVAAYSLNGKVWLSFSSERDFLRKLGKTKHFGSFPKVMENPFFGCGSIEEVRIKLDLMLDSKRYEI